VDADLLDAAAADGGLLYGAEAVHRQLVRWLERCGARRSPAREAPLTTHAGGPAARAG
jgi:hypothetical protein